MNISNKNLRDCNSVTEQVEEAVMEEADQPNHCTLQDQNKYCLNTLLLKV